MDISKKYKQLRRASSEAQHAHIKREMKAYCMDNPHEWVEFLLTLDTEGQAIMHSLILSNDCSREANYGAIAHHRLLRDNYDQLTPIRQGTLDWFMKWHGW